jgi:hypothetical protein
MSDGCNAPPRATIREVQIAVCVRKGLTLDELKSKCRARRLSWPRQVAMALCREMTDASYPKLAKHFGGRDHTTVMWADRKIRRLAAQNPELEIILNQLRERIYEMVAARPVPSEPPIAAAAARMDAPEPHRRRPYYAPWCPERPKRLSLPRPKTVLDAEAADLAAWRALGGEIAA